jgi:hypothetical protein
MWQLLQIPTPQPTNLLALQWVIILFLASVVIYLYRQRERDHRKCLDERDQLLDKVLEGLADVNESMKDTANLVERWIEQFETMRAIEKLAERLEGHE